MDFADVLAVDDLALIATFAFFLPASVIVAAVVVAVVRDRRRPQDDVDGPPSDTEQQA